MAQSRFGGFLQCLQSCCGELRDLFLDILIIMRKNLQIRRRRYVAFFMEMLTPIAIVAFLTNANTYKSLLRLENLEFTKFEGESGKVDTLEGFYDLGNHFDEDSILHYTLCSQPEDIGYGCYIGYVADSATEQAIFDASKVGTYFKNATFIQFTSEKQIYNCLNRRLESGGSDNCPVLPNLGLDDDPVLRFRGAIVFQTSVNDLDVKYKIRLMERYYGSIGHVLKTGKLYPSTYDRREYGISYLESGFLATQLSIDKLIVEHIKSQQSSPSAADEISFNTVTDCTCKVSMYEIPHRQSDQFFDPEDPLELTDDYDILLDRDIDKTEAGFLQRNQHDVKRLHQVNKQSLIVSTILVLSFTFLLPSEQRRIASEKENGLTILLLVTGMTYRMQWFGNLLSSSLSYTPTITIMVILLTVRFNSIEGAVFEYASASMLWLLFFLYVIALASAGYCTTVFCNTPMTAITASVCFWVGSFLAPLYHLDYYYSIVPVWVVLITCLHPSIALQMALRLLIRFEKHRVTTNLFLMTRIIPTDPLRIIFIVIILIFDAIIYMMLAIYLDRILTSKYGVSKPWYYIFNPKEYHKSSVKVAPKEMVHEATEGQPGFETINDDVEPTVITKNLTKKYGKVTAVENLSFELHHGEIFALLGHNGAGKSTTLNLFSGFTPVTSGTATICGYEITTHMVQIQAITGMCPQYSWLYDDLTPYEHLLIFGRLRGLRGADAEEEAIDLMEKLRIFEMAHWPVRKLSTGDQRKVSLAIALVGNPRIILLDEPTAGLDYFSRRAVWDLLLKIRSNHTIIFSTHFMDEAELLGDRIGILSSGKMHVCGSHSFLRRHFGLGYSLKIQRDPNVNAEPEDILEVVRASVPNATLSSLPLSPNANRLCTLNLPMADYSSANMSVLFTDLARVKELLGIVGFSVSLASVDEVFLELTRQLNPTHAEDIIIPIETDGGGHVEETPEENIQRMFATKGKILSTCARLYVTCQKRMLSTWRNKKIIIFQIILPVLIYIAGIIRLGSHVEIAGREGPALVLKLDLYQEAITLFHANDETFIKYDTLKAVIGHSAVYSKNSDLSGDYIRTDYHSLRNSHYTGVSAETGSKGQIYTHFSPYILHSAPLALSLFSNALVKHMDINRRITTTNHPSQHPYFDGPNFEEDPYAPDIYSMMTTLAATTTVSFCVFFPLEERLSGVKHLQLMSGVNTFTYWLGTFIWDLILVVSESIILMSFSFFYAPIRVFVISGLTDGTAFGLAWILYSFLYSGIMSAYIISHFAHSKSGGFALLMSFTLLFGIILPFFTFGVGNPEANIKDVLLWIFQLVPAYAFASCQRKYVLTLLGNERCNHFTDLGFKYYCDPNTKVKPGDGRKPTCCRNCVDIPGAGDCYDRSDFTRVPWKQHRHSYGEDMDDHDDSTRIEKTDVRNIFYEILFMLVVGFVFNCLVVFMDSDAITYVAGCVCGERSRAFQTNVEDEDIIDEMDHVEKLVDKKRTNTEALMGHNLCKAYGTYPALHNVTFRVHPGETFGIIGVNGAGKSTLFKVLTGAITRTYGNLYSVECSLATKRSRLMQKMGYVPQHHSLFDYLTCTETAVFFARLRGFSLKEAKESSKILLEKIGLEKFANTRVANLSGGIKRKLGMVIAVVSEPPIILLDEPTSAADPASRRSCWKVINEIKQAGHTVILSSHRILECEELCHRMVILVDGKFQCIGSPEHLRETFGSGFKLIVKLMPGPAESQEYVSSLSESIVKTFNPCSLRDRRRNVIQYVLHNGSTSWDYLFQMMEHIKLRYNDLVEDYAFSNTTLEEVFLSFVVLQNCGRLLNKSTGCCSCS